MVGTKWSIGAEELSPPVLVDSYFLRFDALQCTSLRFPNTYYDVESVRHFLREEHYETISRRRLGYSARPSRTVRRSERSAQNHYQESDHKIHDTCGQARGHATEKSLR
jgi:hypothetical protein